ncbi:hypothetical protein EV363DRAFT_1196898 [Boletus edulis]|nr:hypothetical protein EV363DRAFT_1196898 [Boletus edulis]
MNLSYLIILLIIMNGLQLFKCGEPCDHAFSDSHGLSVKAQQLKHQLERSANDHPLAELPRIAKRQRLQQIP